MFRNFIYTLKKFKTSSIFNILGLSVALAVFIIIMFRVIFDFSYNRKFSDDIYNIVIETQFEGYNYSNIIEPKYIYHIIETFPEIENYSIEISEYKPYILNNKEKVDISTNIISPGFFELFDPKIIYGDPANFFQESPYKNAMVPETYAKKIFGRNNVLGEKLVNEETGEIINISAVCEDFPENTILFSANWTFFLNADSIFKYDNKKIRVNSYVKIPDKRNVKILEEKINSDPNLKNINFINEYKILLVPLKDIHNYLNYFKKNPFETTLLLISIGIIILLIGYINFINFYIAMTPSRIMNISIQKILGLNTFKSKLMIIFEPVIFTLISLILALFLVGISKNTLIEKFIDIDISLLNNLNSIFIIVIICLLISFTIGIFISNYINSFKTAKVLSGKFHFNKHSSFLRRVLMFIQFVIAIGFIVITIFIKLQHNYLIENSWNNIEKENILYLRLHKENNTEALGNELLKNPEIVDYTSSLQIFGVALRRLYYQMENGDTSLCVMWPVNTNFLDFFNIDLIEGENFIESDYENRRVVVNEEFIKKTNYSINSTFNSFTIKGIVENINFNSLYDPLEPMVFVPNVSEYYTHYSHFPILYLKITGNDIPSTIDYINKVVKNFETETETIFAPLFLDDYFNNSYNKENELLKIISIVCIITILIAVMGVYGLLSFNSKYKEKEIALRKVNGASVKGIIFLLNRQNFRVFIVSFFVAVPLSYFIVYKWLENFPYKIKIYWWVFLLGGLIIFIITFLSISVLSYKSAITNPSKSLNKE